MVDIENVSDDSNERKSENEQEDQRKSDNEEVEPKSDNTGDTKSDSNTVPDSTVPDSTECAPPSTADLSSGLGTARTLSSEQPLMTGTLDVVDVVDLSKDSKEAQTEEAEKAKAGFLAAMETVVKEDKVDVSKIRTDIMAEADKKLDQSWKTRAPGTYLEVSLNKDKFPEQITNDEIINGLAQRPDLIGKV